MNIIIRPSRYHRRFIIGGGIFLRPMQNHFLRNLKSVITWYGRRRFLLVLSMLAAIIPFVLLLVNQVMSSMNTSSSNGTMIIFFLCRIEFYVQIIIIYTTYEFFTSARTQDVDETLAAATSGRAIYSFYLLMFQAIVVGLIQLIPLSMVIFPTLFSGEQSYFLSQVWKTLLINFIMPSLISLLLSYVLAYRTNRLTAYGCILVYLVLISPFAEKLVWLSRPQGFPIDQIVKYIRWPFMTLYQNGEWFPDFQYGLQTDIPRFQLQFFWMFFLVGLSPLATDVFAKRFLKKVTPLLFILIAGSLLVLSFLPAGLTVLAKTGTAAAILTTTTMTNWKTTKSGIWMIPPIASPSTIYRLTLIDSSPSMPRFI